MKKGTKVFGLIAILLIIGLAFVGVVTAEAISKDLTKSAADAAIQTVVTDNTVNIESADQNTKAGSAKSDEDISLDVPFFSQLNKTWKDQKLGESTATIGLYGCVLTSAAMVSKFFGWDIDPLRLDAALTEIDSFDSEGNLKDRVKVEIASGGYVEWKGRKRYQKWSNITQNLSFGNPCIINVHYAGDGGKSHFVVIRGKDGSGFHFWDPADEDEIDRIWPDGALGRTYTWGNTQTDKRIYLYHKGPRPSEKNPISVIDKPPYIYKWSNAGHLDSWKEKECEGHTYYRTYVGGMSAEAGGSPLEPDCWMEFTPYLQSAGKYWIDVGFCADSSRSTKVNYTVYPNGIDGSSKTVSVNQYNDTESWKEITLGDTWDLSGCGKTHIRITDATGEEFDGKKTLCVGNITFRKAIIGDTLNIIAPTQSAPASAGDYENPSQKVDVTVEVKDGTDPVTGLNNADFTFKIGGKTATASLIDPSIPGTYVFSVTPPKQDAAGKYDLEAILEYKGDTLKDTEEEAVIYTAGGHADVMLIIDRSGSMGGSAIADARNSAKLFVDYMRDDDYAGVVSFASSASYNYHLTPLTAAIKIAIKNAIEGISAGGMTAIGAGLRRGLNDLTSFGDTTHAWAMVLLSDGRQNQGEHPNTVLPDIKALDIRVFTIGLGPNVDKALLEHIATETDGEYCYAATSDQLREIYDYIVGKVVGWQTVLKRKAIIFLNQIIQIFVPIENPAAEAIFSISWGGSDLDLVLYKPDGTKIDPAVAATDPKIEYVEEATYEFYRVIDPDPGEWIMEATGVDIPPEGEEFTATVKVISPLFMSLTTDKDQYNQGEVIKTIASITEGGLPITGAAVNADITLPDGSTESLTLYDDGGHGDIAANDGVYANYFTNTEQIGDYSIDVSATGTTPSGTSFSRQAETTVEVVAGQSLINITQDTWSETVSPGGQVKTTFTVSDPAAIGELFMINEYLHAEYNGTHYIVYNESSIGGEPDYIIPTSPSGKALAASPVSKWVSLTATSLQTPTGDIIDVSNIVLSSDVLEVPLGGSNDFNATINVPPDASGGVYSGKIVATAIGGSDSVDVEITVISNPPIADANGPYRGVIEYIAVPITFDGTGSYATDPAGTITSYNWDLDDDGDYDDAVGATPTVSFTAPYSGNIHLKVTDNNGATDTDTTTLTITKHSPPPNAIHGGLLTPPEQPQYYCGTSTIQGKGYFSIDERIQDWATAIDSTEHIEGTGEFEMASKKVLDQAANTSNPYDPNFYHKKTMQFQGNATNRLINREKFESSGIFGGTGTRINEYFDVSMIQKDESSSIKTISAPGSGQSHSFATMDDFSGIWGIHSDWQKICQKDIRHHQMFMGNFSVQKDLTFEREIIMP